jgi:acetyl esterase/lipase
VKAYFLVFPAVFSLVAKAQSRAGITNTPDSSYSNYSAYKNTLKTHPDIRLVPELRSKSIREEKSIVYCSVGERKLLLDAFTPVSNRKKIGIVIIHGGGWRTGNRTQHYPLAQHLANLGYSSFTIEYRLSTEALYPAAVHDVKAAVRWLRANKSRYGIEKIAVLGFSAGGELAAFTGTTNGDKSFEGENCNSASSLVDAVIDIDGTLSFVHPESGEGDDSKSTSAATYWFGYPKKENYALWENASPLNHAGKSTPPTLFLNSSVDRMHAGREDYISILKKTGTYTEVYPFKKAPHSFCLFEPWFTPTVRYIDGFLEKVFK